MFDQQCLHRTRSFCCQVWPFPQVSLFIWKRILFVFSVSEKSASLSCIFELSLPFHSSKHWWEYAHNGIQHRDVIVIKNLQFHPSTRIQQIGIFQNVHSGDKIWKDAFSLTVFTGYVWTPVGQTAEEISAFIQNGYFYAVIFLTVLYAGLPFIFDRFSCEEGRFHVYEKSSERELYLSF